MSKEFKLVPGLRLERLVITSHAGKDRHGISKWLCACDCGNTATVLQPNLRSGNTKSCGCLHSERSSEANKKHERARKIELLREAFEQRFKLDIWPVIDWLRNSGITDRAHLAPLQAEIERWKACYEEASDKHSAAYAESNALADQVDNLKAELCWSETDCHMQAAEIDRLKARLAALQGDSGKLAKPSLTGDCDV